MSVEVTTLAELKRYQQLVLIQDLAKILGVKAPAARSQRELRRLFVVAGITQKEK